MLCPQVVCGVAFAPVDAEDYFAAIAPDFIRVAQVGENLGARLDHVLTTCLNQGFDHVAAINSDGPSLPPELVAQAFDQLAEEKVDALFGPSEDGGYYLIGLRQPNPRLVRDVEMSTRGYWRTRWPLRRPKGCARRCCQAGTMWTRSRIWCDLQQTWRGCPPNVRTTAERSCSVTTRSLFDEYRRRDPRAQRGRQHRRPGAAGPSTAGGCGLRGR
ncbi:MAG: DUF2064 domain-containing protein [Caldilineaceae bacterium]|nr:DUF2064 domain-containing protein [Caldilineaceae bacterium]